MRRDDPAQVHRADFARLGRIGDVVLLELTGAPAGDVEEAVVDRQVDVGDQRRDGSERLEGGWQEVGVGRLGGDRDHLVRPPLVAVAVPAEDRRGEVLGGDHHTDEAPGGLGVVGGPQLERHLVLGTEVDLLAWVPAARSQKWIEWPYLFASSSSGTRPSSIIAGVPHSLLISVFCFRCHQAS